MTNLITIHVEGDRGDRTRSDWTRTVHRVLAMNEVPHFDGTFEPLEGNRFEGVIQYGELASAMIASVDTTPASYRHASFRTGNCNPIQIMAQVAGSTRVLVGAKTMMLAPGTWTTFDSRQAFGVTNTSSSKSIFFRLPLESRMSQVSRAIFQPRVHGGQRAEQALFDMLVFALSQLEWMSEGSRGALGTTIDSLLLDALEHSNDQTDEEIASGSLVRIKAFIDQRLADPTLDIPHIAAHFRCTVRHLHRLFKTQQGHTISEYIWSRRLSKCFDALRDPAMQQSMTDLAYQWGFSSPPHFSRLFKRRFGTTPSEVRHATRRLHQVETGTL